MIDRESLAELDADLRFDAPLSEYTTFRLGGPCPCLITCLEPRELQSVVSILSEQKIPFILIGGGSNLVVSDQGVDCAVIRYLSEEPLIEKDGDHLIVSGSTLLDDLAEYAAENGLEGLNCTTGIPGTVGGAVVGNAGAFGKQIGDVVETVALIHPSGEMEKAAAQDLDFRYRHSNLRDGGRIVASVRLALKPGKPETLVRERDEILALRRSKHPDLKTHPCAGSFFRNVEPSSSAGRRQAAGWFLDQAGAKALTCGGAAIYPKHANIIINTGTASASDVYEIQEKMASMVRDAFDLELAREVRFVGAVGRDRAGAGARIW